MAQLALKNDLVVDRLASLDVKAGYDTIRAELMDLESQMKQIQDSVEALKRLQQRFFKKYIYTGFSRGREGNLKTNWFIVKFVYVKSLYCNNIRYRFIIKF